MADGSGRVLTARVAHVLGCTPRSARRGLSELADLGLARCVGDGSWVVTSVHVAEVERTETTEAEGPKPTDRATVARLGGLQRALVQAQHQRDDAQKKLRSKESTSGAVIGLLIADLRHAFDCERRACPRCSGIRQRLAERHPSYVGEVAAYELADHIERGALAARAGAILAQALDSNGVGARTRLATARRVLTLAVDGDVSGAGRLLQTLEG